MESDQCCEIIEQIKCFPACTRLFHLNILGLGSSEVEALSSHIARLAIEHNVTLISLLISEILPPLYSLKENTAHHSLQLYPHVIRRDLAEVLNGINPSTANMITVMSKLTGVEDLAFSTMMPFKSVLSSKGLIRHSCALCPGCYDEQRRNKQANNDLLQWSLNDVNWCAKHARPLLHTCPYCGCSLSRFAANYQPGFCPTCAFWLGDIKFTNLPSNLDNDTDSYEKFCSISVGELLSEVTAKKEYPKQEILIIGLEKALNDIGRGNLRHFSRITSISEFGLGQLLRGNHIPRLKTLLRITYCTGISLEHLIIDGQVEKVSSGNSANSQTPLKWRKSNAKDLLINLQRLATHTPPLSLEEIARQLQRHQSTLRWHAPNLCKEITSRYEAYVEDQRNELRLGIRFGLEEILRSSAGIPVSLTTIAHHLTIDAAYLNAMFPDYCKEISARYIQYQYIQHEKDKDTRERCICSAVHQLHEQGSYPARLKVFALAGLSGQVRSKPLNEVRKATMRRLGYSI
jgi:hypothetical protein